METKHITDENIQAYVLGELMDEDILLHLSGCKECKAKLNSYQSLMTSISKIEPETFSFDAAALVMQKIEAFETKKEKEKNYTLSILLGLVFISVFSISFPYLKTTLHYFFNLSFFANSLIFTSILGVVLFLISDMIRQYKQKEKLLFR